MVIYGKEDQDFAFFLKVGGERRGVEEVILLARLVLEKKMPLYYLKVSAIAKLIIS